MTDLVCWDRIPAVSIDFMAFAILQHRPTRCISTVGPLLSLNPNISFSTSSFAGNISRGHLWTCLVAFGPYTRGNPLGHLSYLAAGASFVLVGADVALLARGSQALAAQYVRPSAGGNPVSC